MTATQSFRLYELTKEFIRDDEKAKDYVQRIESVINEKVESQTEAFEKIVNKDLEHLRSEMYKVFLIKDDKVDLIKWMVGFWIAQMAAIIGLYLHK